MTAPADPSGIAMQAFTDAAGCLLVERFLATRGHQAERVYNDIYALFAPQEFVAFLRHVAASDHSDRDATLRRAAQHGFTPRTRPQAYWRHNHGKDVIFYSDGGDPGGKVLLLCFGGLGGRLGLPQSMLLQLLDARRFDVVTLRDPARSRFTQGAGSFASSFVGLIRAIDATFSPHRYRQVIVLGNSMGANPAVNYAVLAGVDRVIAVGAQPLSDPRLLIQGRPVPVAFDPLCNCLRHLPLRGIWLYGSDATQDCMGAERLFHLAGGQRLIVADYSGHNAIGHFWELGEFDRLIRLLIDSDLARPRDSQAPPVTLRPLLKYRLTLALRTARDRARHILARGKRIPHRLRRMVREYRDRRNGGA